MNERDMNPLDDVTRELLLAEKRPPGASAEARARVSAKLEASLAAPGPARAPHPAKGGAVTQGALAKFGPIAIAFAIGGAAGASLDRLLTPAVPPRTVYVQVPAATTSAERVEQVDVAQAAPASTSTTPSSRATSAPSSASAESDLGAERQILDRARAALAAGDPRATLAAVGVHAKKFPGGLLEEEREALAVKALVELGRYDEAKARAGRFRARFPNSFLAPTIDAALEPIP